MSLLALTQRLWRRRLLVVVGVLGCIAAFVALSSRPPAHSGLAWGRIVLDTEQSQVLAQDPSGVDSLLWRVQLLADRLTTTEATTAVARAAGVPPAQLAIVEPIKDTTAEIVTPLPQRALEAAALADARPYLVTVEYGTTLPVLSVRAAAPDRASAARLGQAALAQLERDAQQRGSARVQGLQTETVSPLRSRVVTAPAGRGKKLAMLVVLLGLWCAALAAVPSRRRRPRLRPQAG